MKIATLALAGLFFSFSLVSAADPPQGSSSDGDTSEGDPMDEDAPELSPTTFWVDGSCRTSSRRENFNSALRSALEMALRGYDRVSGSFDQLTAGNFEKIFHTPITDAAAKRDVRCELKPLHYCVFAEAPLQRLSRQHTKRCCEVPRAGSPTGDSKSTTAKDDERTKSKKVQYTNIL